MSSSKLSDAIERFRSNEENVRAATAVNQHDFPYDRNDEAQVTRREFWTHINGVVQKGVTVLVTTHFMDEAEYCDRIGLVFQGELIAVGDPDELKRRAASPGAPDPSMEETFITLVERHPSPRAEAA